MNEHAARIRSSFRAAGFTVDALNAALGPVAAAALGREERVPVINAFPDPSANALATYVRLFVLGDDVTAHADVPVADLEALELVERRGGVVSPLWEVRPYGDDTHDYWVVSDLSHLTRRALKSEHVLGVGGASTTLAYITPRMSVQSAADVGTGCGVQALHLSVHAKRVVATDISNRALKAAQLSAALSDVSFETRQGSFLEPLGGEHFDLIVSNPPFVISPKAVFEYRDAGLRADAVGRQLVQELPALLNPGGVAIILANWLHVSGQPWRDRVTSWVSGLGVQAWIVQREVQDPAQYVAMWLRDAAAEGAPLAHDQYAEWLAEFEALNAQAVGFGWIVLRNSGSELITVDDHSHAPRLPRGDEVIAALDLQQLVEQMDAFAMLNTVLLPVQGLVVRSEAHRAGSTWMPGLHRLVQAGSWRAPVETDDIGARVVHACDGQRTLGQILDDLAQETGLEVDEVLAGGLLTARALLAEGLLVPQLPARI